MLSSNWAKALEPNILEWAHEGFNTFPDTTTEVFSVMDKSAGVIRFHDSWGPRIIPKSSERAATTLLEKQKGYETILAPQIFKGKMMVTRESRRWIDYDSVMQDSKDLGSAAKETLNLFSNSTFINAFSTSYTGYGDGLPLASTVHTRPDGGSTQSNASSTGITLTESNLETGMNATRQQKSGTGKKLAIGPGNLVLMVPEALDKEAVIITGSQKRSNTTDNDLNWYLGKIAVYVNPFLGSDITDLDGNTGSDTAWFLTARGVNGLTFVWDQRPVYNNWEDEDTDSFYTKVYFSCKATWKNWVGLWGSKGDGLSYSS